MRESSTVVVDIQVRSQHARRRMDLRSCEDEALRNSLQGLAGRPGHRQDVYCLERRGTNVNHREGGPLRFGLSKLCGGAQE